MKGSLFGRKVYPSMKKASKFDHGPGPKAFTHMNKAVAGTGSSQHPKHTTLKHGRVRG